ncbi:MAG: hypothetical protein AAGA66_00525 [Bacteroidota bacterium]
MIQKIRKGKFTKFIAAFLALQTILPMLSPIQVYALTGGPAQPEFQSFTPIGTSDMVNLASGDFNYNIPLMDVGGYPLNLSYQSGVTMDQEASWVGLGWNVNVGQINRQVRGIPDDFKGDELTIEKNMRDNVTVGVSAAFDAQVFGLEMVDEVSGDTTLPGKLSVGVNLKYNNYTGLSFKPSYGISFDVAGAVSVGMNVETSATEGVTVSPSVGGKAKLGEVFNKSVSGSLNAGVSYNSNVGLSSFSLNSGWGMNLVPFENKSLFSTGGSIASGKVSFNNKTMTPRKRTAFRDINGTVAVSFGASIWGIDGEAEISAMGAVQKLKDPIKKEKAFGYEFTGFASPEDQLDYNREKDGDISKSTLVLPMTNYTYDLYSVQGQGISGMFRPFRSQVGQINDELVEDQSESFSLGVEIEAASSFHAGVNFTSAPSVSRTGVWDTRALQHFKQQPEDIGDPEDPVDYEPTYFKYIGEPRIDQDQKLFEDLGGYDPIALKISGSPKSFNKQAANTFYAKKYLPDGTFEQKELITFDDKFKKKNRDVRNQNVQKFTKAELYDLYSDRYVEQRVNKHAADHHTAEIRITNPDGSRYVFGETAYNKAKKEVTFTTDSKLFNCASGIVKYNPGENSIKNKSGKDNFYDAVNTPPYAHTYLLSSVLSTDYEDLTGDGPSEDDLGAYTTFEYETFDGYQWRVPYGQNEASYNAGLNSDPSDQKGSYIYGEKELKYLKKITTKTHVALFDLSPREDGRGVAGEDGGRPGANTQQLYKIDKIRLYSKPEYEAFADELEDEDPANDPTEKQVSPIKVAHFEYDYSLCEDVENNFGADNEGGKLTLLKVYFTYRNSKMGKYTPYVFHYDGMNPSYNLKSYDIWGNYKPNTGSCATQDLTAPEFPFVQQEDREEQDRRAAAWSLTSVDLPSGGEIALTYESDDYQYVQNRPAMQMFKVVGAGRNPSAGELNNTKLYKFDGDRDVNFLYVQLPAETDDDIDFKKDYLKGVLDKPIYFRFFMNMTKSGAVNPNSPAFDYVTGYFEIPDEYKSPAKPIDVFKTSNGNVYAAIPMKRTKMEGGIRGGRDVNPISKAGWYFGRKYLNGIVYGINQDYRSENIETIAKKVISSVGAIKDIASGPNGKLRSNEFLCAQRFIPQKSWIRLSTPGDRKLGGGVRVKQLAMKDNWSRMIGDQVQGSADRYDQQYGQEYEYTLEDGGSSGVATFEPNSSKENPLVEPFYNKGERLIAPREVSYVEKPFGESFFPAATVTYSRVAVSNLKKEGVSEHATGKVVTEHFTSKDYPTRTDHTNIENYFATNENDFLKNLIKGILGGRIESKNEFTLSQGFVVHTNDMNGKMRAQNVFAENSEQPVSSVEYKYSTSDTDETVLDNKLPLIDRMGNIHRDKQVGVDYDLVTDFRESYTDSRTTGYKFNVVTLTIGPFPVIIPAAPPSRTKIENIARSTITTKVINTTAVLKEKVATDLGSRVSTINEAWDAETGQVLLTRTVNEFDDEYYNFNFPAYWSYDGMAQASKNTGIKGILKNQGEYFSFANAANIFALGDELVAKYDNVLSDRLWVVGFDESGGGVLLMNRGGQVVNKGADQLPVESDIEFTIIRSGHRNQQLANMGAVTMMRNPIRDASTGDDLPNIDHLAFTQDAGSTAAEHLRIVNASAVEYDEFWNCQCESQLPFVPYTGDLSQELLDTPIEEYRFNPYLYNVNNEWRAKRSYAYLTERVHAGAEANPTKVNTRREGYFSAFDPYYVLSESTGKWQKSEQADEDWTFASEVTQYTPYGAELENKDALERYSSAQYGYDYTLPTAVSSNSRYRFMGMDAFEDYTFGSSEEGHFNYRESVDADGSLGVRVSEQYAHTGRTSLLLPPNEKAELTRQLLGEYPEDLDSDDDGINDVADKCPYLNIPDQTDYDGDGIGDLCDDDPVPQITMIKMGAQTRAWNKESEFIIHGNPNSTVNFEIQILRRGRNGLSIWLNDEPIPTDQDEYASSVELDLTGKAYMTLKVQAHKDKKKNRVLAQFVLMDQTSSTALWETAVRMCPRAFKRVDSGTGDTGHPEWNCDSPRP